MSARVRPSTRTRIALVFPEFGSAANAARFAVSMVLSILAGSVARGAERSTNGLLVLYDFRAATGTVIEDHSGVDVPLNLKIANPESVIRSEGSLEVRANSMIRSDKPAAKIIEAVKQSGAISIEAWILPAQSPQRGPARIITLSQNPNERNATLGQEEDRFDVRLRTTQTSGNGLPSLAAVNRSARTEWTHVVYVRDRNGRARLYVNGRPNGQAMIGGDLSNWDPSFRLALGNELTGDRPWLGTYRLVAIFGRRLSQEEITRHFEAGTTSPAEPERLAQSNPEPKTETAPQPLSAARHFDSLIAPILGRHCVECHGPEKQKGRLDLSRRDKAFAGGKSGKVIVPGQAEDSLLWQNVESDEMPDERPPLTAEEKRLLHEWIEAGAVWSGNDNAPLAHAPIRRGSGEESALRRLTVPEYVATVQTAVGVDVSEDARRILPPDLRADGFNNTAYNLHVDLTHIQGYAKLARLIVSRMDVKTFAAKYAGCQSLSESCMRELITQMGAWLLRGPMDIAEVDAYLTLSAGVEKGGGDFASAAEALLEAMLQSPRFLYRVERPAHEASASELRPHELASRLSYILWGAPPDAELIQAASNGTLTDRRQLEAQVERMLGDPRAVERSLRFACEWLNLDRLEHLRPDPKRFPKWDSQMAADLREETLAFFKHIAWEAQRPLEDLFNAQVTFTSPRLAQYYGLPVSERNVDSVESSAPDGLLALYTFQEATGNRIRDVSGVGEPINLRIENPAAVHWQPGQLTVREPTLILSERPPVKLTQAIKHSHAFTVEAWIHPAQADQSGPARIVTLSSGPNQRNFTLGQDGSKYDVRLRATKTDQNGLPSLSTPKSTAAAQLAHVAYTRDVSGRIKLYVDGRDRGSGDVGGDLSNWDESFHLALANETTKDRTWRGSFLRVAIYDRALTAEEIRSLSAAISRYDLARHPARGGLLTQGSLLSIGGDNASMVTRGLFVLQDFLWGKVDNPPPCVDTTPVPPKPGLTRRAIAESRLANASCGACHARFEPFAFGLERFDGLGAYSTNDEHGNALREDGQILFPGSDEPVSYASVADLMDLLAGSERVQKGITRKATQFALGHPLSENDEPALTQIHEAARRGGGTYASLMKAIVLSDLVHESAPTPEP